MAMDESLAQLRELSVLLATQAEQLPDSLEPIASLITTQRAIIDAWVTFQNERIKACTCRALQPRDGQLGQSVSHADQATSTPARADQTHKMPQRSTTSTKNAIPDHDHVLSSNARNINPAFEPESNFNVELSTKSRRVTFHGMQKLMHSTVDSQRAQSSRQTMLSMPMSEAPSLDPLPESSPLRTWFDDVSPGHLEKNSDRDLRSSRLRATTSNLSSSSSDACQSYDEQNAENADRMSSTSSDRACEVHVQQAMADLITAKKERRKIPIAPFSDGLFQLHSVEYRQYYSADEDSTEQRLVIFDKAVNWKLELPHIPDPAGQQVAMELTIRPDCQLIVKPFIPPQYADWEWRSLPSVSFHADTYRYSTVEAMFLGNGFLKLKVRLSDLLRRSRSVGDPDKFVEFGGVWQANKDRLHRIRSTQIPSSERPTSHGRHISVTGGLTVSTPTAVITQGLEQGFDTVQGAPLTSRSNHQSLPSTGLRPQPRARLSIQTDWQSSNRQRSSQGSRAGSYNTDSAYFSRGPSRLDDLKEDGAQGKGRLFDEFEGRDSLESDSNLTGFKANRKTFSTFSVGEAMHALLET